MRIDPTEAELVRLRERVRPYYTEKRFAHALEVEREADYISGHVCPERQREARAASILHDIAKKLCYEKQLNYIRDFGIMNCNKLPAAPVEAVAHAAAGAAMTEALFPEYARDRELVSAIRYHSTGRAGMTVLEAVVFLADYIEPTRTHETCRTLRAFFHEEIERAVGTEAKLGVLRLAVMRSLSDTIAFVSGNGGELDPQTSEALLYFKSGGCFGEYSDDI